MTEDDEKWMARAIRIARQGWGDTHPNPVVGAVLVADDRVLGEGFHARAGGIHAEVAALEQVEGEIPPGATLYVTLEPCSSTGRTPPCTDAILESGVRRVVVGTTDNDSRHRGRGISRLREKGLEVLSGVLDAECRDLNLIFHHVAETGNPLVAVKIATTIDGRTATATGSSRWITGDEARKDVHRWRRYFPAIAVGAGTVLRDDPALTARNASEVVCPIRLVFDRSGRLADCPDRRIFTDDFCGRTVVFSRRAQAAVLARTLPKPVSVVVLEDGPGWFSSLREWLCAESIGGVYVEGGSGFLGSLFAAGGVDYLFAYRAPKMFLDEKAMPPAVGLHPSEPADGLWLAGIRHETHGEDQLIRGFVRDGSSGIFRENTRYRV